jgi:mannose/fructose/N-acetylgalactosamine-specific phosphotransferase system component IIC
MIDFYFIFTAIVMNAILFVNMLSFFLWGFALLFELLIPFAIVGLCIYIFIKPAKKSKIKKEDQDEQ